MPNSLTASSRRYIEALADELDISDTRYRQAEQSYMSLGQWLNRPDSTISRYDPVVYVQGSFGLGTVIRPLNEAEEYDVDSVCELKLLSKNQKTQQQLKMLLGLEIEAYRKSKTMVKPLHEGRRCWTLNYADEAQFHMDIVPALPNGAAVRKLLETYRMDAKWTGTAIAITDNERSDYRQITDDWPRSNPKGYLEWFKSRIIVVLNERKRVLAKSLNASVEKIPDYKVRTPLQASIMILKRHRDIMFEKDAINCCPISIIITTLAAHAYGGQEDVGDALLAILTGMETYILRDRNGRALIPNPTDPMENFADKWEKHPERERAFFKWLRQAQADYLKVAGLESGALITETLSPQMGTALAKRAETRFRGGSSPLLRGVTAAAASSSPSFGSVPRVPSKPKGFA
ncbi:MULTISPECIES: nucleotidyltransferase domain-containing protein [unclassified Sphingomonas]|uniref:nucleotidyltransferase domain-containing protein n=1 Tax=unclassified Sphingomonas TaxID=196159 RepID=UPI0006FE64CD|nr:MULTISPECIES: nucleotidyltransferase [unclassified Sphingomonas]KQM26773.1 hypothetical protein ASE58_12315 [Sphingomonas sp. Leaf9]KQM43177.1 hypothetical protein ASE57_12320 [Sphingomonas sp. Leaf11]